MLKLILLDRDGVINIDSDDYIKSPDEWHAILGSLEAISMLNKAGMKVAIASNQSGIARGYFTEETLHRIHEKMHYELAQHGGHIDKVFYCPHGPKDACDCRKPKPGLLFQAFQYFDIKPEQAYFIGDSQRDIEAAHAAGCSPIFVGKKIIAQTDILSYSNLLEFVKTFLGKIV